MYTMLYNIFFHRPQHRHDKAFVKGFHFCDCVFSFLTQQRCETSTFQGVGVIWVSYYQQSKLISNHQQFVKCRQGDRDPKEEAS